MVRLVRLGNAPRHARGAALVADGHLDLTVRGLGRPRVRRGTVWLSNSTGDAIPIAHFMGARASLQIKLPQGSSRFRFIQVSIRPGPPTQPDVSSSVLRAALP